MATKTLPPDPEFTLDAAGLSADAETGRRPPKPSRQASTALALLVAGSLALLLGVAAVYFVWQRGSSSAGHPASDSGVPSSLPQVSTEPAIKHPVDRIPAEAASDSGRALPPLPHLDESDTVAKDSIATILGGETFMHLIVPTAVIRHIVATVDNLPRKTIAVRILPVEPVPGAFATANTADGISIAPDNARRYAPYVAAADSIDTGRLVQFYVRLYPLFQQAYVELGYPNGYFNDRLIEVIDHLLAAPEPKALVHLAQPRIMFEYAEPELEVLSAGQKILVRMGTDNEMRIKAKLRELRRALGVNPAHP